GSLGADDGLENIAARLLTCALAQATGERGGLRKSSFWSSFSAVTTGRASLSDFRISTSLETIASACMARGAFSCSSAKRVRLLSSRMRVAAVYSAGVKTM